MRTSPRPLVSLVAAVVLLAGCSTPPQVTTQRFADVVQPVRASDAPVQFFGDGRPACPFTKIGYVKVEGRDVRDRERLPELVRAAVRELGGDAVIGYGATEFRTGPSGVHPFAPIGNPPLEAAWVGGTPGQRPDEPAPGTALVLAGTVVRYADGC